MGVQIKIKTLKDYIESQYNGSPSLFAKTKGIAKQQVNEWLKHGGYYIESNRLFLLRKDFN